MLAGCSSTVVPAKVGPNGEYIGWHCSGDIASDGDWLCEQKTLKDGKVVTAAVSPQAAAPVAPSIQEPIQESVKDSAAIVESVPSPVAEAAPAKTESSLPTTGYSLQLGAYLSRQQAEEAAAEEAANADKSDDGWTKVEAKRGRRKTTEESTGTTIGSIRAATADRRRKEPKKIAGEQFYRFQSKEKKRNEIIELQAKFEQDKQRIARLKAARKFRPM